MLGFGKDVREPPERALKDPSVVESVALAEGRGLWLWVRSPALHKPAMVGQAGSGDRIRGPRPLSALQ